MQKKLPLFYLPPTICWIDDNQLFLDAASGFFKDCYNSLTFNDPKGALDFLISQPSLFEKINFTRELKESDLFNVDNHLPIDINISEIAQLSVNPSAKKEIAVLIIDNNMPNIKGIEVCHALKNQPYKKILLTGETEPIEVIDAFNSGVIDKFITKDDSNIIEKLKNNIQELAHQYFTENTKNLLDCLEISRPSPLSDPIFVDFFLRWIEKNQLHEFYLLDRNGSFLLRNNNDESIYFIMMSDSAKNEFLKLNSEIPAHLESIISQVSEGKLIPFFGNGKESWEYPYNEWSQYFFSAETLKGREQY